MAVQTARGRGRSDQFGAGNFDEGPTTPPADDDPFAIDPSVTASAIPVSRQPGPSKPLQVVCPMCETKGFVSLKAAGKQVKCCNPQCMVPIFTAPAPEKKPVAAPPPPKKKIPWHYVAGGIAAVAIAGYCIWVMQDPGIRELPPLTTYTPNADANGLPVAQDGKNIGHPDDGKANHRDKLEAPQTKEQAREEIIKKALLRMLEVSSRVENRRHEWRRLAILAYLFAGQDQQAREQLELLTKRQTAPYEGILPLVSLAWRNANRPAEFQQAIGEARVLADKLPPRGRYASEAAVALAPLLIVSGKVDDARQLVLKHHTEPLVEQLAAALRVVVDDESYDLDTTLVGRTVGDWQKPLETAVTLILAAHGRWDDALSWASQSDDSVAKTEGIIVWAESYVRQAVPADDATGWERAAGAARDLTAEGKARLLARLAAVKFSKGDQTGAEDFIAQAELAMKTLSEPKAIQIATVKQTYDLKLPSAVPLRQAALAATEIAGVHAQLGHDPKAAWNNVRLGLHFLRAIGPSVSAMQALRERLEKNQNGVRDELASAQGIKKSEDQRSALAQFKRRFNDAEAASLARFYGQLTVLKAAAKFGMLDQVWDELQSLDRKSAAQDREPFLSTALPLFIAARYEEAGNVDKKDAIISLVEGRVDPSDPDVVEQSVEQFFKSGDLAGCINYLNASMTSHGTLHEFALRLACCLVKQGKVAEAIAFCHNLKDQAISEDGLFLTAALASRTGTGEQFWKAAGSQNLNAMEMTAICSGLVVGFNAHPSK
jgi:hypothetical protein